MQPGPYELVYDHLRQPQVSAWPALVAGAFFVVLGLALVFATRLFMKDPGGRRPLRLLGGAIVVVSLLASSTNWFTMKRDVEFRRRLAAGEYVLVEGVVTAYVPGDLAGHDYEEWTVASGGRIYRYWLNSAIEERGYGEILGPVRLGSRVRIADVDGRIARLEVARW